MAVALALTALLLATDPRHNSTRNVTKGEESERSSQGITGGLLPHLSDVFSCCSGTVADTVDTLYGKPVVKEFLEDPVKTSIDEVKKNILDKPEFRKAARTIFVNAVEDIRKEKRREGDDSLSWKDAANIARSSWEQLSMKFGIVDEDGNSEKLPKPSLRLARRVAKQFMAKDGTISEENFQKFRKALMESLARQTIDKRVKPSIFQYALGVTTATALVAYGRTKVNMSERVESVVNFLLPSIVIGPLLGLAITFKLKGGNLAHLTRDVRYAKEAVLQARQTVRWTHDALSEVSEARSKVNNTRVIEAVATIWNVLSAPEEKENK